MSLISCNKLDFNFYFNLFDRGKVIILSNIQTPLRYISKNQIHKKENYSCGNKSSCGGKTQIFTQPHNHNVVLKETFCFSTDS